MSAPTIIQLVQGSPEWLAYRRTMRNASESAAVLGLSPWSTPYQLWLAKTGRSEVKVTAPMRRGTELEPAARLAYEEQTGLVMQPLVLEIPSVRMAIGWQISCCVLQSAARSRAGCKERYLARAGGVKSERLQRMSWRGISILPPRSTSTMWKSGTPCAVGLQVGLRRRTPCRETPRTCA